MQYKTYLSLIVIALTFTGVAVAQSNPINAGNTSTTVGNPPPVPDDATVLEGEVISSNSKEIVLRTKTGEARTFSIDAVSAPSTPFNVGDRVRVAYTTLPGGVYQASDVSLWSSADLGLADNDDAMTSSSSTYTSSTTQSSTLDARLPDTASNLPLIGLLGLLALGGAWLFRVRS
jgi:LPXTG-motif cell wall-anchored protein